MCDGYMGSSRMHSKLAQVQKDALKWKQMGNPMKRCPQAYDLGPFHSLSQRFPGGFVSFLLGWLVSQSEVPRGNIPHFPISMLWPPTGPSQS